MGTSAARTPPAGVAEPDGPGGGLAPGRVRDENAPMRRGGGSGGRVERSLARRILVLQTLLIGVLVVASLAVMLYDARSGARAAATARAVAVATTISDTPGVAAALRSADPTASLQPYAQRLHADVGVDFVVVMSLDRVRYTHPNPGRIGERFLGDVGDAPFGWTFTQEYAGTLGPSVRAVAPVRADGRVIALVSVGITIEHLSDEVWRRAVAIVGVGALVLAAGLAGTLAVGRRLRRATRGLSEAQLARIHDYHHAVLHAVREGLILLDRDHRVRLVNDEARRLLDLPERVEGRDVTDLGLPPALAAAAVADDVQTDDVYLSGGNVLVVSSRPARFEGSVVGTVVTLRDRTELQAVSGELDVVRRLTAALRAQNHESANRLHTVVSLVELGRPQEAVEIATEELQVAQLLTDQVVEAVDDPVLSALLLGKTAEAAERGIVVTVAGSVTPDRLPIPARDLVTVAGNLVDNALDAVGERPEGRVDIAVEWSNAGFALAVDDSGPGIPPDDVQHALRRGWSTKAGPPGSRGIGLALVAQTMARHGGRLDVTRSPLGGARVVAEFRPRAAPGAVVAWR